MQTFAGQSDLVASLGSDAIGGGSARRSRPANAHTKPGRTRRWLRGETIEAEILYQYAEQYFRALREQE
jgi:hypothetical protein